MADPERMGARPSMQKGFGQVGIGLGRASGHDFRHNPSQHRMPPHAENRD
jgi:hypothetical protein